MSTVTHLVCDVCGKSQVGQSGSWFRLEQRFISQETGCVDISEGLDICGAQCLTRWIGAQKERRRYYSPAQQWRDDEPAQGWSE